MAGGSSCSSPGLGTPGVPRAPAQHGLSSPGNMPLSGVPDRLGSEVLRSAARGRWGEEEAEGDLSEMPGIHLPLPLPSPFLKELLELSALDYIN